MLADLYKQNDMSAEAEKMYRRALNGYEKARGSDHPTTISIVNSLHLLESNQVQQEGGKETS